MGITRPRPDGGVKKKTGIARPRPDGGVTTEKTTEKKWVLLDPVLTAG